MDRALPRPLSFTRWFVGVPIFALFVALSVLHLNLEGRPYGMLAFLGVAAALVTIRRPLVAAAFVIGTSAFLQVATFGTGHADQLDLAEAALERVLAGQSPYGVLLNNETGGVNPFAYGPLALVTGLGDRMLELVATTAVLGVLTWQRAWITLCLLAASPMVVQSMTGGNEGVPTLLLALGFVVLRTHPKHGMVLIALAGAVKPHVVTWFLPAIGFAGWSAGAWLIGVSALLWSPVLLWGVGSYIHSLRLVYDAPQMEGFESLGLDVPWVRYLSVPVMLAGLWVKRWNHALLVGAVAYTLVMFFGAWAHLGYLTLIVVTVGLALEA